MKLENTVNCKVQSELLPRSDYSLGRIEQRYKGCAILKIKANYKNYKIIFINKNNIQLRDLETFNDSGFEDEVDNKKKKYNKSKNY